MRKENERYMVTLAVNDTVYSLLALSLCSVEYCYVELRIASGNDQIAL